MEKQFALISHDRHRDDYVYLIKCKEEEIESFVSKIWEIDFGFKGVLKSPHHYSDGSGDYVVEVAILKELNK